MMKTPEFQMVGEENLFVPPQPSDNLAHLNPIPSQPPQYDGQTIETMHGNLAYVQGYDAIDKATLCRDQLVRDSPKYQETARNFTETIRKAFSGKQSKDRFSGIN